MEKWIFKELQDSLSSLRGKKTIVFVHGIFDLLHAGHIKLLENAKMLGDILVVGVENDQNTKVIKGPDRPIHAEAERLYVLSQIKSIDYVALIPPYKKNQNKAEFYDQLYRELQPDILATCVAAGKHGPLKQAQAEHLGIQFVDLDTCYENSTSKVIKMLRGSVE